MLKHIIFLFSYTTFVVVLWIGMNVYHNTVVSQIKPSTQKKIEPIDPTFDKETLDLLEKREIIQVNLNESASVIREEEKEESATTSATLEEAENPISP